MSDLSAPFGVSWVEWFGYAASVVVAISLTMSSIVKLRWFNLTGATMFSAYGFVIGAWPVGFLNLFIVAINIMYLLRLYRTRDDFRVMRWTGGDEFLKHFIDYHRQEIERFFPRFDAARLAGSVVYCLVRNASPIGLLIGRVDSAGRFEIDLDYVGPSYRDFRMGSFLYQQNDFFRNQGFSALLAAATGSGHDAYLERMGFVRQTGGFIKML